MIEVYQWSIKCVEDLDNYKELMVNHHYWCLLYNPVLLTKICLLYNSGLLMRSGCSFEECLDDVVIMPCWFDMTLRNTLAVTIEGCLLW